MKIVQVDLKSFNETLTTWVDKRKGLKPGAIITLKDYDDPKKHWEVVAVYGLEKDAKDFDFHRKWDNNNYDKHGGLNL